MKTMAVKEHEIWNSDPDFSDWEADLRSDYPDLPDEDLEKLMYEINNNYLDDERHNLNIKLPNEIVVIADIGRWNGRFNGYRVIATGNIKDCLCSSLNSSFIRWYVDKNFDLRCTEIHHDGTNYLLYRQFKDNISDTQKENFLDKIYNGTYTPADISRYTKKIGTEIRKVYGW